MGIAPVPGTGHATSAARQSPPVLSWGLATPPFRRPHTPAHNVGVPPPPPRTCVMVLLRLASQPRFLLWWSGGRSSGARRSSTPTPPPLITMSCSHCIRCSLRLVVAEVVHAAQTASRQPTARRIITVFVAREWKGGERAQASLWVGPGGARHASSGWVRRRRRKTRIRAPAGDEGSASVQSTR